MTIESDASLQSMPKVKNQVTYSRAVESRTKIFSDKPTTVIVVKDWEDKEAAQKVLSKRSVGVAFDPKNEAHVAQYEAAGSPDLSELDAHGNPWRATELEEYWDGNQTVKPPFQTREIELPLALALAVANKSVPGTPLDQPKNPLDEMTAQLYLALIQVGVGENMKSV